MTDAALRMHPWSEGFVWADHDGPFRTVTEEQAAAYDRDGFFLLRGAIPAETIAKVRAAIDPLEERTVESLRKRGGTMMISDADSITFSANIVVRDDFVREFVRLPLFQDLCHDLVGPDARLFWDQAVYKKPEPAREFPWHQDNGYGWVQPATYLTCWIPLVDATVDNGCPWVVPGLHRLGTLEHVWTDTGFECLHEPADAVAVPADVGDVVVFSSLTPHRTGPNTTDSVRKAYILQYAPNEARRCEGDPAAGGPIPQPVNDDFELPILVGGAPAPTT